MCQIFEFLILLPVFTLALIGDVELTNMQLKPEALNALKLPVKVKAGFLGSVKLKVSIDCVFYVFLLIRHKMSNLSSM